MICLIGGQLLPNFIPVNESKTRPDVLHAIYTPKNAGMKKNWLSLKTTLQNKFPALKFEEIEIEDEYDAVEIKQQCEKLLRDNSSDNWSLNATGGTKLMSLPAIEVFGKAHRPVYYVETPKKRMLLVKSDWSTEPIPFENTIDVTTYFQLYGREITIGGKTTKQEQQLFNHLSKLNWQVWQSVKLKNKENDNKTELAEFDVIGIEHYSLSHFECKNLQINREDVESGFVPRVALVKAKQSIKDDLYKLAQTRNSFGGPFGKSFWVFRGRIELESIDLDRIKEFNITLIRDNQVDNLLTHPSTYNLPDRKANKSNLGNKT